MQEAQFRRRVFEAAHESITLAVLQRKAEARTAEREAHQREWTGRSQQAVGNQLNRRAWIPVNKVNIQ